MQNTNNGFRWAILFVAVFGFVIFNFDLQSVPPLLHILQVFFNIDASTAGLLMSLVVIPGIFLALPAGMLINRHGFRSIGGFSALLVAAGARYLSYSASR